MKTDAQRYTLASGLSRQPGRRAPFWHWFGPALLLAAAAGMYGGAVLAVLVR